MLCVVNMDIESLPALVIPCEDLQASQELLDLLFKNEILTDESFRFLNVPENINEILNTKDYFKEVDNGIVKCFQGQVERNIEDLL